MRARIAFGAVALALGGLILTAGPAAAAVTPTGDIGALLEGVLGPVLGGL